MIKRYFIPLFGTFVAMFFLVWGMVYVREEIYLQIIVFLGAVGIQFSFFLLENVIGMGEKLK